MKSIQPWRVSVLANRRGTVCTLLLKLNHEPHELHEKLYSHDAGTEPCGPSATQPRRFAACPGVGFEAGRNQPYLAQQASTDRSVRATICDTRENYPLPTNHSLEPRRFAEKPALPQLACRETVHVSRTRGCECKGESGT
jgi:hypothetical protein